MILLFDAEITAHKACGRAYHVLCWDKARSLYSSYGRARDAFFHFRDWVLRKADELGGDKLIMCLSDPEKNFRKVICPTYKEDRSEVKAPLWAPLMDRIRECDDWDYRQREWLEADDCLGIASTARLGDTTIVSDDKDMATIPGHWHRPCRNTTYTISVDEAERNLMVQALCGDTADGYKGCKGIGPKKIEKIEKERGPVDWVLALELFENAGHDEAYALEQVRMAKILTAGCFDFETQMPLLWRPNDNHEYFVPGGNA